MPTSDPKARLDQNRTDLGTEVAHFDDEPDQARHRTGTGEEKAPNVRPIPHYEDAWPHLLRHLPDALREAQGLLTDSQLPALIEARFRAGDAIYRGEWMDHDPDWFVTEAMEEAADLCTYLAMRRFMRAHYAEQERGAS